ncbi:hypothetical protein PtA15_2A749 [Puccinia triticina]|uniref:Uncharacterized protein n=1 Tax=Puccinia triticina TaxID=208348 RepID=A0ABY7CD94_9BASI|nr:uncharacterized protein PtA15_2A749 [Puccinia triticina]WAQ82432.1 hypothetical protein PtA15_2A749 [Puccinia triticina]
MFPGHPDYILCEETQQNENNVVDTTFPTRMVPIDICCLLFLKNEQSIELVGAPESLIKWTKVSSKAWMLPWLAHIQSMHWKEFHNGALDFLSQKCLALLPAMQKANQGKEISWFGSISGHPKYGPPHGFLLQGHLDFLGFGAAAYEAHPEDVKFQLIMEDPRDDPSEMKYTWTLTEDAHNSVIPGGPPKMLLTQTYQRTLASVANNRDSSDVDELASTDNTSDASHRAEGHIAKHQRKNAHTPIDYGSDIEIVDLPKRLFLPKITAPIPFEAKTTTSQSSAKVPRVPMGPARRAMEQINMETYLWVAHIDTNDMDTCKLLKKHKITHWSFFRSSDKDDLMALGFSIGAARSLWEGVPRLEEYVDDLDHNRCVFSPPASSHL